jgi:hypothetical protein
LVPERKTPETGEIEQWPATRPEQLNQPKPADPENCRNASRRKLKTPATRSEPTAEPLAAGRAARAEAATNEVRVRRPTEANRRSSAKMN